MGELRGGQTTGCITPQQSKEHKCKPPWFTLFKPLGTLWRCDCGNVYRLDTWLVLVVKVALTGQAPLLKIGLKLVEREDNYGFIYPTKETLHRCSLLWILFKPVGTLWRCGCGEVYRLTSFQYGLKIQRTGVEWRKSTIEEWLKAGGTRK